MKLVLSIISLVFLFYENIFAQNWMELEVGNKTLERGIVWINYGNEPVYYLISVEKDTLIENQKYFLVKSSNYMNPVIFDQKWFRYDRDSQKVYWRVLDTSVVYMDFNLSAGQVFAQFNPLNGTFTQRTIFESNRTIFGVTRSTIGFIDNEYSNLMREWIDGIGLKPKGIQDSKIIQDLKIFNQDTNYNSYGYLPDFSQFNPLLTTSNLNVYFNFWINHHYTYYASIGVFDFIKDVYFDCYYKSEYDSLPVSRIYSNYIYQPFLQRQVIFNLNSTLLTNGYSFYYKITAVDKGLIPNYRSKPDSGYYKLIYTPTHIEDEKLFPTEFSLSQNYPNPFNPSTKISWQSPVGSWQTLKVYDVLGKEVATLVDEYRNAGNYEAEFNPESSIKNPASGIYFYQLNAGDFIQSKKMILLK